MSQKEVYEFNVPTFGKGVVFDVDHLTRAEQFRFFADSLKSDRLRSYVGMMVKEAEDYFGKWGESGEVGGGCSGTGGRSTRVARRRGALLGTPRAERSGHNRGRGRCGRWRW